MRRASRFFPLVIALAGVTACTTWSRQSAPPAQVVSQHPGALVRVTRTDHSVITLRNASVVNDSLVGTTDDKARLRVAMPVADVVSVDTREVSAARTAGLGIGAVGVVLAVAGIAATIALLSLGGNL
jgi:hypothetical protein